MLGLSADREEKSTWSYCAMSIATIAVAEIEAARKIAPASPMLYYTRALLALHQHNYAVSREDLNYVFQIIPQHMPSILLSGALFYATAQFEQARRELLVYLRRYPGNLYARSLLAATLLQQGQPRSAIYVLEPVMALAATDAMLKAAGIRKGAQVLKLRKKA